MLTPIEMFYIGLAMGAAIVALPIWFATRVSRPRRNRKGRD